MRILIALPHVYNPSKNGKYGSTSLDCSPRVEAFKACVGALRQLFGGRLFEIDFVGQQSLLVASDSAHELDIVVLTTRGLHLLDKIDVPNGVIRRLDLDVEPLMVEFECQRILAEGLGHYDYYCFLEDDCIIRDPFFFQKLQWFAKRFGDACLLQPNRYEIADWKSNVLKTYIDGNVKSTAQHQDVNDEPELLGEFLDRTVRFLRPSNPHAASYFLSANQMKLWTEQPHFLDRATSLAGPLESAATLGIMRTFRTYKAAAPHREFLEIQHSGSAYLSLVGKQMPLKDKSAARRWWPFFK
jgi:hypothetical protein